MLDIVQAGQAGKTGLLFAMHRFRKRVFKDMMGWDVPVINDGELEVDDFDLPHALYLLALSPAGDVTGSMRLLPTDGPTMIRNVWPESLQHIALPSDPKIWEISRFAVDCGDVKSVGSLARVNPVTQELFCGLVELCLLCGVQKVVALYDTKISQIHKWLNCAPEAATPPFPVQGGMAQVGIFRTDLPALERLRRAAGMTRTLITAAQLPPLFLTHR